MARGWTALSRWRGALASDPMENANDEPLEAVRHVAGKSSWDALSELVPSAADVPLRDALKNWVLALLLARIGRQEEVDWAQAASDPKADYRGDRPRFVSWREAWRGVVSATTIGDASLWLDAAAQMGPSLAPPARKRSARRLEAARRMGFAHPWDIVAPVGRAGLRQAASRLLDATEDLSLAVWRQSSGRPRGAPSVVHDAVAREAGEGWPARLTPRWVDDLFGPMARGRTIDMPALPATLGASSFVRGLRSFGYALRIGASPGSMPFALTRYSTFLAAHRLGLVLASLALEPDWQVRALGVGRRVAQAQSRVLARTALLEARTEAARLILGDDAEPAPREAFDELGVRLFQAPLDARLRGAWPAPRDDEPARLVALLQSRTFADRLRDVFDADWYRNPRAWSHLHGLAAIPDSEPADAETLNEQIAAWVRFFEGALG